MLEIIAPPTQINLLRETLIASEIKDTAPKKRGNPGFKKKFKGATKPVRLPEQFCDALEKLAALAENENLGPSDLAALWEKNKGAQDSGAIGKEGFPLAPVYMVPLTALNTDPKRFQYKMLTTDKYGSTNSLGGVSQWDENLSGTILVWKDPSDNLIYVINGHNRFSKAKALGVPSLKSEFIQAETAAGARAIGALKNIAEGNGSIIDAAKFFRDRGYTSQDVKTLKFLPIKQSTVTLGAALADLAPYLFDRVIQGSLDPKDGAVIAALSLEDQADIIPALDRGLSGADLSEYCEIIRAARRETASQVDLFGSSLVSQSDAVARAKLMAKTVQALGRDKRLFSGAAKNADILARGNNKIDAATSAGISDLAARALEKFQALKLTSGPVADLIGAAASGSLGWDRYIAELLDLLQ